MREIAVVVKTAKRKPPKKSYLWETLENLERSGAAPNGSPHFHSLHLAETEGPVWRLNTIDRDGWELLNDFGPRTFHQNCAWSIRVGVSTTAPWVLVVEDDVDFCADLLGSVLRWIRDAEKESGRFLMYPLGANYSQIRTQVQRGRILWEYPVSGYYGNQALLWRRENARALVRWLGPDPNYNGVRDHGHDLLLHKWAAHVGVLCFATPCPSFVQHIGQESGLHNRFFTFPTWPGREWRYR